MTSKTSKRAPADAEVEEEDDDYVPYVPVKQRRRMALETAARRLGRAAVLRNEEEAGKSSGPEDEEEESEPSVGPNAKIRYKRGMLNLCDKENVHFCSIRQHKKRDVIR